MKKAVLSSLLALSVSVCAEDSGVIANGCRAPIKTCPAPCASTPLVCKTRNPCRPICDPLSLSPASNLCDTGIYVVLDALCWYTTVGNSDWSYRRENGLSDGPEYTNFLMNFKSKLGFRLGIGSETNYDDWDFGVFLTWFRNLSTQSATLGTAKSYNPLHTCSVLTAIQGINNWKVLFNGATFILGRGHYLSRNLAVHPHIGLQVARIKQKIQETYSDVDSLKQLNTLRNIFFGVGPLVGLDTKWILGDVRDSYFYLFGDFDAAVLYGKSWNDAEIRDLSNNVAIFLAGLNQQLIHTMFRTLMGLGWDTRLSQDTINLSIRLGYEIQYWFHQNQFLHLPGLDSNITSARQTYHRLSDDLVFQGLVLGFRFDF